jgi:hypothetical protein
MCIQSSSMPSEPQFRAPLYPIWMKPRFRSQPLTQSRTIGLTLAHNSGVSNGAKITTQPAALQGKSPYSLVCLASQKCRNIK